MATLLAGTEAGLLELTSGGNPVTTAFAGQSVDAIAGGPTGWWAVVDGAEVWSADEPGRWARRAVATGPALTCLAATPAGPVVGTAGAHLARLVDGRLQRLDAFDHAEGRHDWYTPWGGPPDTRSLSVDAHGTLFVNVHVGGILRSTDAGRRWAPTIDLHADVHQVVADAGGTAGLVLAACAEGLGVSDDGGTTWRIDDEGLHATYSRAVAASDATVIVSASTGPRGDRCGLYRRRLVAAGSFERCRAGLPEWFGGNIDTACLVAGGTTVAAATADGEAFASDDDGATWRQVAGELPRIRCLALA